MPGTLKWYQKGWGVVLLGLITLVIGVGLIFAGLTGYYWWKIKHGGGVQLSTQFSSSVASFTKSLNSDKVPNLSKVDRPFLEGGNHPYIGATSPQVVVVEFVDFKCPNCKAAHPILQQVIKKYGSKVKLIVRNFPAETLHPGATRLAELGVCAKEQGRFWQYHNYIYEHQESIPGVVDNEVLNDIAVKNGFDIKKLQACLVNPQTLVTVNKDYADGFTSGVAGTPTFFINGEKVEGVIPQDVWEGYLNSL
jgi:protein-disulfide isomerase